MSLRFKITVSLIIFFITQSVLADTYVNGWTESTSKEYVLACSEGMQKKQLDFMYTSGQIKRDATASEINEMKSKLVPLVTTICSCVHSRVMRENTFDSFVQNSLEMAYANEVVSTCAKEVNNAQRLAFAAASTSTDGAIKKATREEQAIGRIGFLMGYFLPILCVLGFAAFVGWKIFRPSPHPRDKRSRW